MPKYQSSDSELLPAKHRDKLRMLLVLKGYSSIACGRGMKVIDQRTKLHQFFYGDPPNIVSHVNLLCKGVSDYSDLYEDSTYHNITNEGKNIEVDGLRLKPELILDYNKPYYAGVHITSHDIKNSNRSNKVCFITPKTLLNWARSSATDFRRADAYCSKWWDATEMKTKISGDTEEDVRRKVIQAMWIYQKKILLMQRVMMSVTNATKILRIREKT